jgi:hypothetical protein
LSEPINLNKARKARAKAEAKQTAVENRVRFGRTKAEKAFDQAQADKRRRQSETGRFSSE